MTAAKLGQRESSWKKYAGWLRVRGRIRKGGIISWWSRCYCFKKMRKGITLYKSFEGDTADEKHIYFEYIY